MRLIVIGGGASGVFCAVTAARLNPGLEVVLLEQSSQLLSKVRISGGGRCNLTHACEDIGTMIKNYPRGGNFLKRSFHHFFTTDTIEWFTQRSVPLKTEADGRMFPVSDRSESIISCLVSELNRFQVAVKMNAKVTAIHRKDKWQAELYSGEQLESEFLCVACGGFPKTSMFEWLKQTGHTISDPVPSLFTFNLHGHLITRLMGVAVQQVRIKIAGTKLVETGPLLITHWGLSGPAVLKLSAWGARILKEANYQYNISINWLPELTEVSLKEKLQEQRRSSGAASIQTRNPFGLPQRLWEFFLEQAAIPGTTRWADLTAEAQRKLMNSLLLSEFAVSGKTTFKEEFVTAGGITLKEVNPATMESRIADNLFFAGEILDVDGITGGYNFQHAWTSGWIAGNAIAARSV